MEFSFNTEMYKQLEGMAMGSPVWPTLANILVDFNESKFFDNTVKPDVYFKYVDDTFIIFGSEMDCDRFPEKRYLLHLVLKFTVEEQNSSFNFLDDLMQKRALDFLTSLAESHNRLH